LLPLGTSNPFVAAFAKEARIVKSPTQRLLIGLLITLAAVAIFSWDAFYQLNRLRLLQDNLVDRNRHDSLLLVRVLNDVNTLGATLRYMTDSTQESKIIAYRDRFTSVRRDLEEAVRAEAQSSPVTRQADKQAKLLESLKQFWGTSDRVFAEANAGKEDSARSLATLRLADQQSRLASFVSLLLQRNNEAEERTDLQVAAIYASSERNLYLFIAAVMIAIIATTLYLIYSNRKIFERLECLSTQRRVLAAKLITVQEEVLRSVSRELHDEFGQILTAVSAMLGRAERKGVPPDSPLRTELSEVREITHNTLEKMRSLSQMLHPAVLDDYGLVKAIEWYTEVFEKQTGIATNISISGTPIRVRGQEAIHCYRIVQEALNNAAKHSAAKLTEVEMIFAPETLTIHIRDFGRGMVVNKKQDKVGLGLIAMQERAELVSGKLTVSSILNSGTTVTLEMPLQGEDASVPDRLQQLNLGEVVSQK
jgi:signal transduction histidine kinase